MFPAPAAVSLPAKPGSRGVQDRWQHEQVGLCRVGGAPGVPLQLLLQEQKRPLVLRLHSVPLRPVELHLSPGTVPREAAPELREVVQEKRAACGSGCRWQLEEAGLAVPDLGRAARFFHIALIANTTR